MMKNEFIVAYERFWSHCPALLYASALAIGMSAAFGSVLFSLFILCFLLSPFLSKKSCLKAKLYLAILIALSGFCYVKSTHLLPQLDDQGIDGVAYFVPDTIGKSTRGFSKRWIYTGKITHFLSSTNELSAKNIPATVDYKESSENRPLANRTYRIQGKLRQSLSGNYFLYAARQGKNFSQWIPTTHFSYPLCELRYEAKTAVANKIKGFIKDPQSATFLAGIATGSFDDNEMFVELGRFGLQHIMAISGFHFAIVAAILGGFFKIIFPPRYSIPLLILAMSSYFIFLGASPSVIRAWLTIIIALSAFLLQRTSSGLNTLGGAVLFILLYDPLMVRKIGFQFSALMTLAILLFYPLFNRWMMTFLPKRTPGVAIRMAFYDQYGYFLLVFFRNAFSLSLAVNLFALPLTLYYFHKFPVMGLLYNLFFPFLVSISILLLIIGMGVSFFIPVFGSYIHDLNNLFTKFTLDLVYQMPTRIDIMIRVQSMPSELVITLLCVFVMIGIFLRYRLENKQVSFPV